MIRINLLSPDDKLNGKWEKINKVIVSSAVAIVITQLVFVLLIFISIKYLEIENDSLNKQLENLRLGTKAREIVIMRSDIENYGDYLECVSQIQREHLCWTKIIDGFSRIVPDEIRIKGVHIEEYDDLRKEDEEGKGGDSGDSNKYKIVIKGESRKEDYLKHLLEFENNLKESKIFELIIEDYLEKNYISDSDFEFKVFINKSEVVFLK